MMKTLIEQVRTMGLKVSTLSAFANNKRAIHVYEKVGFVRTGRILKKFFNDEDKSYNEIMTKMLE